MAADLRWTLLRPGVTQLTDPMGVCMTLLEGTERALLVDTGYGLTDVRAAVTRHLPPDKPLDVLLTHGHHDHALGAPCFDRVWLFPEDAPVCALYTGEAQRRRVLASAAARGIPVDAQAYLARPMPPAVPPPEALDLGGLRVRILKVPGHTPGSAVVLADEEVLLTGDDWNLTTWLFFPEALPIAAYRANMQALLRLPFTHAVCSHQEGLFPRARLEAFLRGLTDEAIRRAAPCPEGAEKGISTVCITPAEGQKIVFDRAKA